MNDAHAPSPYLLKPQGSRPHITEYSCDYGRFIGHKEFPRPQHKDCKERLQNLAKGLMQDPIPGLAELHDFKLSAKEVSGVFEVLPGQSLDAAVEELEGLPAPLFLLVVQQLLDTVVLAFERGEVELFFDPRSIYVWRHGDDVFTGFAACEFHVGHEHETEEWVHWLRQLAILWYHMATGEWMTSYYVLVDRDLSKIRQLQKSPALLHFFDHLFHPDVEKRVFDLERLHQLIAECDEEIGEEPIPPAAFRVLDRLPHKRICLSWMVSEDEFPSQYTLSLTGRDARRPTIIPAHDEFAGRAVFLHILPPEDVTGKTLQKISDQAELLHDEPKLGLPILPIVDSWEIGECRIYAEHAPDGPSLACVLERVGAGLPLPHVLNAARKIDRAIRQVERAGITIPSYHPADVFLVSTSNDGLSLNDFGWIRDPGAFTVHLRALPTGFLHLQDPAHYENDHKAVIMRWILGTTQKVRFAELVARLLSHRELTRPSVKEAIQRASDRRFKSSSLVRVALLGDLTAIARNPDSRPATSTFRWARDASTWRTAALPHVPPSVLASAAALVLGLGAGLTLALNADRFGFGGSSETPYASDENGTENIAQPPENLLPVSGE
ncbi:MAG: hypothetical protein AAF585_20690, partial [Verrucomicrobiota bacterium]